MYLTLGEDTCQMEIERVKKLTGANGKMQCTLMFGHNALSDL